VVEVEDVTVRRLAALFERHPAWLAAARHISGETQSDVYFRHRPGEPWHLERRAGGTRLLPGASGDPDFVFRFTEGAIERLESVHGGVGDFAAELFVLLVAEDDRVRIDIRIAASFPRLAERGYLRLLLAAGPTVIAFGAAHGVRTLGALRRFVAERRSGDRAAWEVGVSNPKSDREVPSAR
jgi:hypothetical protein